MKLGRRWGEKLGDCFSSLGNRCLDFSFCSRSRKGRKVKLEEGERWSRWRRRMEREKTEGFNFNKIRFFWR